MNLVFEKLLLTGTIKFCDIKDPTIMFVRVHHYVQHCSTLHHCCQFTERPAFVAIVSLLNNLHCVTIVDLMNNLHCVTIVCLLIDLHRVTIMSILNDLHCVTIVSFLNNLQCVNII